MCVGKLERWRKSVGSYDVNFTMPFYDVIWDDILGANSRAEKHCLFWFLEEIHAWGALLSFFLHTLKSWTSTLHAKL